MTVQVHKSLTLSYPFIQIFWPPLSFFKSLWSKSLSKALPLVNWERGFCCTSSYRKKVEVFLSQDFSLPSTINIQSSCQVYTEFYSKPSLIFILFIIVACLPASTSKVLLAAGWWISTGSQTSDVLAAAACLPAQPPSPLTPLATSAQPGLNARAARSDPFAKRGLDG